MKKFFIVLGLLAFLFFNRDFYRARAQEIEFAEESTTSAESTSSAEATSSSIVRRVVDRTPDLTEDKPEIKGRFERLLEESPVAPVNPFNALAHGIRYAVSEGVPANTLILILMFPLIATVVVFTRHIIGLKSFGIFTPALLSVAFLSTGLTIGISLFVFIIIVSTISRYLLKRVKIQYLPRMAIFMWAVSMGIFFILMSSPIFGREELITIGIFPILILILLNEDYLDLQITRNFSSAMMITFETVVVAVICYFLMKWEFLQSAVLLNPELFVVTLLGIIAMIERYDGLRLLEIWRFRNIIGNKSKV